MADTPQTQGRKTARHFALALAIVAGTGLILRVVLSTGEIGSIGGALSHLSQFFTILTNTAVCLAMIWIVLKGALPFRFLTALTASIVTVGLVYHAVLAQLWNPEGLLWVADHFVHTLVPIFTLGWWLAFADKRSARWTDAGLCIVWPLVYCAYALGRAQFSDFYPYPFLDVSVLGAGQVAINSVGLSFVILLLGFCLVAYARYVGRPKASP